MSNPFEKPRNLFPLRAAPYNPNRDAERARDEKRRDAELAKLRDRPRTLFDVQDHLKRTGRGHLMRDISDYNQPAVEHALSQDLDQAVAQNDQAQALRLRYMIYLAATEGFPIAPALDAQGYTATLSDQARRLQDKIEALRRAGEYDALDEQEDEAEVRAWPTLMELVNNPDGQHDVLETLPAVRFLEHALHYAYQDLNQPGADLKKRQAAKAAYSGLRAARNWIYWRIFKRLEGLRR